MTKCEFVQNGNAFKLVLKTRFFIPLELIVPKTGHYNLEWRTFSVMAFSFLIQVIKH